MKNYFAILIICFFMFFAACADQQARRPISQQSGSFMKESISRNKKLNKSEERVFDSLIKANTAQKYIDSQKGFWYSYEVKSKTLDSIHPKRGDVVIFDYNINDVRGNVIYSEDELKTQTYSVDKENIMQGLRIGVKLMKKNETVTFLFPSAIAFGYFGDKNKIGANIPIICTVTLLDIRPEIKIKNAIIKKEVAPVEAKPEETPEQQIKSE
jgi:gliding motility-associated peptidyl-prolyl isomerase